MVDGGATGLDGALDDGVVVTVGVAVRVTAGAVRVTVGVATTTTGVTVRVTGGTVACVGFGTVAGAWPASPKTLVPAPESPRTRSASGRRGSRRR